MSEPTVVGLKPDEIMVPAGTYYLPPPHMHIASVRAIAGGDAVKLAPNPVNDVCPACAGTGKVPRHD